MYPFYVRIVGARQGASPGEAPSPHEGKLVGLAFELSSSVPDGSRGRAAARAVAGPVRFTRAWGAASPFLLAALATGETLTEVTFEFVRTTEEGIEAILQQVRLHGARVVGLRRVIGLDAQPASLLPLPPLEEVTLSCTGLDLEHVPTATTAMIGTGAAARRPGTRRGAAAPARPLRRR